MPRGRTIMFVDNSNVFQGQLNAGWRIAVQKLQSHLERNGEIWQTFIFASVADPPRYRQTQFYNFLKRVMRWEVLLYQLGTKTVKCRRCNGKKRVFVEKGVDVGLATKMLTLAHNKAFDTAILVAADRDYLETVKAVKSNGLRVEIIAWRGSISTDMEDESSRPVVFFDDIRGEIEMVTGFDTEAENLILGQDENAECIALPTTEH